MELGGDSVPPPSGSKNTQLLAIDSYGCTRLGSTCNLL